MRARQLPNFKGKIRVKKRFRMLKTVNKTLKFKNLSQFIDATQVRRT
jgi:hypothetical protein